MKRRPIRNAAFRYELWPYALVFMMILLGTLFGSMATRVLHLSQREELKVYLESYLSAIHKHDAFQKENPSLLKEALSLNFLKTALPIVLSSLSLIGVPLIVVIAFLRGFMLGFGSTFLVRELRWRGGLVFFAGLLPQNIFLIPGLVILGGASVIISLALIRALLKDKRQSIKRDLEEYFSRFWVGVLIILLGCFMEAYVTPGFLRLLVRL